MAGIVLEITVDDKGTPVIKRFSDESKKAFKEMEDGPKQAKGSLDSLKDSWIGLTAKIGIATAAIYAAKKLFYDLPKDIASATNEIERQAGVLGISTDEFQKWQYAAKMSDVNAQEFGIGLKMLSRNMEDAATGSGDASKYFSAMGISIKDSAGNLLPLNQVMMEIANRFSTWQDGPRKIAIAMQLFGRSGEALIPILNQGKVGIGEFGKEAEKTGAIIRKDVLKAGSEADKIFRDLSEQWQSFKLNLAPTALELAKFLEQIQPGAETIRAIFEEINRTIRDVKRAFEGLGIISPEIEIKRKIIDIRGPQITPPVIAVGTLSKEKIEEDFLAFHKLVAEAERLSELGKMPSWEDWAQTIQSPILRDITQLDLEFAKVVAEAKRLSNLGEMPDWRESIEVIPKGLVEIGDKLYSLQEIIESYETTSAKWVQDWVQNEYQVSKIGETLAQNVASAWNFNLKNIISESQSMGDAVKKVFFGMGDAFTSAISKMISDWMLFGDVTGKKGYESGKGIIGWLGGLFGGGAAANVAMNAGVVSGGEFGWGGILQGFQHGADFWANKPMIIGVGEGGERERVTVTPESKMQGGKIPVEMGKRGGDTYIYFVNPIGFDEALMKNMGTILKGIAKDARMAGPMHSIIKGYG